MATLAKFVRDSAGNKVAIQPGMDVESATNRVKKPLNVVSYRDNKDGTTTNFLSDGSQDTGRLVKSSDGSYDFTPLNKYTTPVGTLTVEPKSNIKTSATPIVPTTINTNLDGLYKRTNVKPYISPYSSKLSQLESDYTKATKRQSDLQKQYADTLVMSPEEQAIKKELLGINQGERSDIVNTEGQGRGTPLEIIGRQQNKISKDAALQRLAASENLQALTGVRQSKSDSLKALLGFEDSRMEKILGLENTFRGLEQKEKEQARQDISDILDFSNGLSFEELDPSSQQQIINAVAKTPFTLGQVEQALRRNKVAYDEERQKSIFSSRPASVQEYEYAKQNGYTGTYEQYQNDDANRKAKATGLSDSQLQTALNAVQDDFRQDPAVQQYTQAAAGWDTLSNIDPDKATSADNISAIYAFAKIMDPGSVVREGEYSTVQKYAQSWAQQFGFNAARIFSNTKFLSADAMKNLQAAAKGKITSLEKAYTNARSNYDNRITTLKSGQIDITLPNYGYTPANGSNDSSPSGGWF